MAIADTIGKISLHMGSDFFYVGNPGSHLYYNGETWELRGPLHADDINASGFTAQTANIADAAMTSAKIDNLAVNTLKIADNAVTVPVSVDSGAFIDLPPGLTVLMEGTIDAGGNGTTDL